MSLLLAFLAPLLGGLIIGFERRLRARMQNRQGPPLLQPYYDMAKLFTKRPMHAHPYHTLLAILHFLLLWVSLFMLLFGAHLLSVIFTHLLAQLLLVLAGFSVNSPFSRLGAQRKLLTIVAYEPLLLLSVSGFYVVGGGFQSSEIYTTSFDPLSLGGFLLAYLFLMPLKLDKSPFDITHAHQEITGGVEIEYSGWVYEFLYMARWVETIFVFAFLALFSGGSFGMMVFLICGSFLLVNLIDNATARLQPHKTLYFLLPFTLLLGTLNLIGVHL